jgi:hypothetical protein
MKSYRTFLGESKFISAITSNLGIPRDKMPQIRSVLVKDFLKFLKSRGVNHTRKKLKVDTIRFTQKEISIDKIKGFSSDSAKESLNKPVLVSRDGYLLDGHHRVGAVLFYWPNDKIQSIVIDTDINSLLALAKDYPKTTYKSIEESNEVI